MNGTVDAYLGRLLKNWVSQRQPSSRVRARLLWRAALPVPPVVVKSWWRDARTMEVMMQVWLNDPVDWSLVYSPLIGAKGLRLLA